MSNEFYTYKTPVRFFDCKNTTSVILTVIKDKSLLFVCPLRFGERLILPKCSFINIFIYFIFKQLPNLLNFQLMMVRKQSTYLNQYFQHIHQKSLFLFSLPRQTPEIYIEISWELLAHPLKIQIFFSLLRNENIYFFLVKT